MTDEEYNILEEFTSDKGHQVLMTWDRYRPEWRVVIGVFIQHSGGESIVHGIGIHKDLNTALREAEQEAMDIIYKARHGQKDSSV